MNISEEASKRYPFLGFRPRWVEAAQRDAFVSGAEWARKEALREAAEAAKSWGRENEEGGYARSAFTVARKIRELIGDDAKTDTTGEQQ